MNNHGGSAGAILNGNLAENIPPNLCYPLESQVASFEHQKIQQQQRQANYSNFGEFNKFVDFSTHKRGRSDT